MSAIHRYWSGTQRDWHGWTASVVRGMHPADTLTDWTPQTLPTDVAALLTGDARHDSNLVRYALLDRFGGLWLDHDVIPLQTLTTDSRPWVASVGSRYEGSSMWFPQAFHPVLFRLLAEAQAPANAHLDSPARSGADLLSRVLMGSDVRREPRALPLDAHGQRTTGIDAPIAVHLWESTAPRWLAKESL